MRRLLDGGPHGVETVLQLVVLAYVLQVMMFGLVVDLRAEDQGPVAFHVQALLNHLISFITSAALVFGIGRLFGGQGTVPDVFAGVAWIELMISVLVPVVILAWPDDPEAGPTAIQSLLLLASVAIGVWMIAGSVAEMHRFQSTGSVILGMLIVLAIATLLTMALVPAG